VLKSNNHELSDKEKQEFESEAALMKRLPPHPNVIRLVGVTLKPCSIVTEFAEKGSLIEYLIKRRGRLSPSHRISMSVDACEGVIHLHLNHLIHRDIAARNFLIHEDGRVLVADFGMSRELEVDKGGVTKSNVGPLRYMSPEQMGRCRYSEQSDVWAFGILLWEIETGGEKPYGTDMPLPQIAMAVVRENLRLQPPPNCIPGFYETCMAPCWAHAPADRATMSELHAALLTIQANVGRLDEYWVPDVS